MILALKLIGYGCMLWGVILGVGMGVFTRSFFIGASITVALAVVGSIFVGIALLIEKKPFTKHVS